MTEFQPAVAVLRSRFHDVANVRFWVAACRKPKSNALVRPSPRPLWPRRMIMGYAPLHRTYDLNKTTLEANVAR